MARRLAQSQHQHDCYAGLIGRPYEIVWGCSSAGEHFVDIEGVTGSIPVTPTIFLQEIFAAERQSWRFFAFRLVYLEFLWKNAYSGVFRIQSRN